MKTITIGEMRSMGMKNVPESMPDCAEVELSSFKAVPDSMTVDDSGKVRIDFEITGPARWVEATMAIKPKEDK